MTTKKTTPTSPTRAKAEKEEESPVELTAEEIREQELADAELLADLPELRPPHALRVRHKNRLMAVALRLQEKGVKYGTKNRSVESQIAMLDAIADIDEFAESIAYDKEAYEEWAIKNAENIAAFFAILSRYTATLGE